MKRISLGVVFVLGVIAILLVPIGETTGDRDHSPREPTPVKKIDLSAFSDARIDRRLQLLFIHHSVGGALFAAPGPTEAVARCIWRSHPEGGNARSLLEAQGYEVNEASYGSLLGEKTDLFDWLPKFRDDMAKVLTCDHNDDFYAGGQRNDVVVFKSCYPNNRFVAMGEAPGDPRGPELTVWNARATLTALLPELQKQPDTLFVFLSVPPQAPPPQVPLWKWAAKKALGKPAYADVLARESALARQFNDWVVSEDGWLAGYPLRNVVVFDLFGSLVAPDGSNLLGYPSGDGHDSHPGRAGNQKVAEELVPFINRAVRRAGLVD
jgi:hypothetical protein